MSNFSVATCGSSCVACSGGANTSPACDGGACEFTCSSGFEDCDSSAATGCEADTRVSTNHCGGCFQACDGLCADRKCYVQLAAAVPPTWAGLFVRGGFLVFGHKEVQKVPVDGGTVVTLARPFNDAGVAYLAADNTHAFWIDVVPGSTFHKIHRVALDGSAVTYNLTAGGYITALTVGSTYLYWHDANLNDLVRANKVDGGQRSTLFSNCGPVWGRLVTNDTQVAGSLSGAYLYVYPPAGCPTANCCYTIRDLAISPTTVFFSDTRSAGSIKRLTLGSSAAAVIADSQGALVGESLALNGGYVYFSNGGSVRRVPEDGGAVEILGSGLATVKAVAVDDSNFYLWLGAPQDAIYRRALP